LGGAGDFVLLVRERRWPSKVVSFANSESQNGLAFAAVFSLALGFRLGSWCSLSIGGWQPSGAAAPAISFLLDRRRRWPRGLS
jgi:hypothetical protein